MSLLKIIGLLFVLCGSTAWMPLTYHWVINHPRLAVQQFVFTGNRVLSDDAILSYVAQWIGKPMYAFSLHRMEQTLLQHPGLSAVWIERLPPHTIHVRVQERIPVGFVKEKSNAYLLDQQGLFFGTLSPSKALLLGLPQIVGLADLDSEHSKATLRHMARSLWEYKQAGLQLSTIKEVHFHAVKGVGLQMHGGLYVELGKGNFNLKWQKFHSVMQFLGDKQSNLVYMGLAFVNQNHQVMVRFNKKSMDYFSNY